MGYASEMARAAIAAARAQPGFAAIVAGVDEVNAASLRVLAKLGFELVSSHPGHFGRAFLLQLDGGREPEPPAPPCLASRRPLR